MQLNCDAVKKLNIKIPFLWRYITNIIRKKYAKKKTETSVAAVGLTKNIWFRYNEKKD